MYERDPTFAHMRIRTRQGFDAFVVRTRGTDGNIVDKDQRITDINTCGFYNPTAYHSMAEIEGDCEWQAMSLSPYEQDHDIIERQIRSEQMMLRVLAGEEINFDEFCLACIDFVPQKPLEDTITERGDRLEQLLNERGMSHSPDSKNEFEKKFLIPDPKKIERHYIRAATLSNVAHQKYGVAPGRTILPTFVTDNKLPWPAFMSTTSKGRPCWKANTHPDFNYTKGKILAYTLHEGSHVQQTLGWRRSIREGEMNPAAGLTSPQSSEIFHAEAVTGLAQTLQRELAKTEEDKWMAEFQIAYDQYYLGVAHNAHVDINSGVPEAECVDYMDELMHFELRDRLQTLVIAGRDLPSYRAAWGVYWPALEIVMPIIDMDPNSEARREAIKKLYAKSLTIEQVKEVVAEAQAA